MLNEGYPLLASLIEIGTIIFVITIAITFFKALETRIRAWKNGEQPEDFPDITNHPLFKAIFKEEAHTNKRYEKIARDYINQLEMRELERLQMEEEEIEARISAINKSLSLKRKCEAAGLEIVK